MLSAKQKKGRAGEKLRDQNFEPTRASRWQAIVVETIKQEINKNPTIKARLLNALKAGGTEALTQALDAVFKNPLVSIPVETIKGFIEA